jgi:Ca2+-binding RTX toxin-like protein
LVADDDWILSWTSAGPTTSYVYLKDTGVTAGLVISEAAGNLGVSTAIAATFSANGVISFNVTEAGTASMIRVGTQSQLSGTTPVTIGAGGGVVSYTVTPTTQGGGNPELAFLQFQPSGGNSRSLVPNSTSYIFDGRTGNDSMNVGTELTTKGVTNATTVYSYGHGGDDNITGWTGVDVIYGGDGSDIISGGNGADTISGGAGVDDMSGGADADKFVFATADIDTTAGAVTDIVSDFVAGTDTIGGSFGAAAGAGVLVEAVVPTAATLADLLTAADTALDGTVKYYVGQVTGGDVYVVTDSNGTGYTDVIQLVGQTLATFDGSVSIVA